MISVSCAAPYGQGGLGNHLAELVEEHRRSGSLLRYLCSEIKAGDEAVGQAVRSRWAPLLCRYSPIRFRQGLAQFVGFDCFDRAVAERYPEAATGHIGFSGQSLHTFRRAARGRTRSLELVSPTAHLERVRQQHQRARAAYPLEADWLHSALLRKGLREYAIADRIKVGSHYVAESFLAAGFPQDKLVRTEWHAAARFRPAASRPVDGVFRVLYTGLLTVTKGVPLLLDAFAAAQLGPMSRLTLVGGTGSRGMRKFVEVRLAGDSRIQVCPGDPLPHLHRADLYVHPSYQDGSPYAVAEALAVGVPVIVSEDTGSKELVELGVNGWIIPTGDLDALVAALEHAQRNPLELSCR